MAKKKSYYYQPHDAFFRRVMSHEVIVKAFLRASLPPAILCDLALESLAQLESQYISRRMDFVCRINIKGKDDFILVLIEHQSTPDKRMAFRVRQYVDVLIERYGSDHFLPAVIPLVLYTGKGAYPYSSDMTEILSGTPAMQAMTAFPTFFLILPAEISRLSGEKHPLTLVMRTFELVHSSDEARVLSFINELDTMTEDAEMSKVIQDIQCYLFAASKCHAGAQKCKSHLQQLQKKQEGKKMATMGEYCIRVGRMRGRQEGRQEGESLALSRVIANMFDLGLEEELIARSTQLSLREIKQLSAARQVVAE